MRFDPVECGKRMKALRESKNLTQMQLAEQLNISLNHVKALEHARRLFSIDLVIEISAFFDVSLAAVPVADCQRRIVQQCCPPAYHDCISFRSLFMYKHGSKRGGQYYGIAVCSFYINEMISRFCPF